MSSASSIQPQQTCLTVDCQNCRLGDICLPIALSNDAITRLSKIVKHGKILQQNDSLYRQNSTFSSIYALKSGSIKTVAITADGEEQITGFYLPGEILGIDGLNTHLHRTTSIALETTAVCEIPFVHLEALSLEIPELQRRCFHLMSQEISSQQQLLLMLAKKTAEERVAFFIINLSDRYARYGFKSEVVQFPMSRQDIANFLGLTIETVSRVFNKLQQQKLIESNRRELIIHDQGALRERAGVL